MASALTFAVLGRPGAARAAATLSLVIGVASLAQYVADIDFGLDELWFRNQLLANDPIEPGRPSILTSVLVTMLGAAILLSLKPGQRPRRLAIWLASSALGIAAMALFALVLRTPLTFEAIRAFAQSLPAGLATSCIAIGTLIWRSEAGWSTTSIGDPRLVRRLRIFVPCALATPAFAALLGVWLAGTNRMPADQVAILFAGLNIVLVAGVVTLAVGRVARAQTSLDELTLALDTAAIVITDLDDTVVHWSRGCEQMLGWPASEIVGQREETYRSKPLGRNNADLRTASPDHFYEIERSVPRKDGSIAEILVNGRRIDGPDRDPVIVYSVTDITERNRIAAELRRAEELATQAIAANKVGVFDWDVIGGQLIWSPGSEERLGLAEGNLGTFDAWRGIVSDEDIAGVQAAVTDAQLHQADRYNFRFNLKGADGVTRMIEGSARCYYAEPDGTLVRSVGVAFDITERAAREAALQASRDQLETIINTVPDAMVVIDERNIVRRFSQAAEQMFGYRADEVVGENMVMLMPASWDGAHDAHLARYLQTGQQRVIGRVRSFTARRADGTEFPIEVRVGEAMVGGERLFTGFIRDTSERIATEERLTTLRDELAHISRTNEMGDMAANMAHELNQPLAATVNFLAAAEALLKRGDNVDQIAELLTMARQQSLRTGEIIRRLREFMARRDVEMRTEPVRATVEDAVELMKAGMGQVEIGISMSFATGATAMFADRIQIQQVIVNLMRNAFEAVRPLGRDRREVLISTRPAGDDMVEISVSDTGPGLPPELEGMLGNLFVSSKPEGMGIGLSICRRIIEAHGGTLSAENRDDGRGATFRFTVPLAHEKEVELT